MRWKFRLFAITAGFIAAFVILISIEVCFRLFSPDLMDYRKKLQSLASMDEDRRYSVIKEPDPFLMWRLKPGSHLIGDESLNSKGFRGPDFEVPKPPERFRIICLGDSRTFGFGISSFHNTFSAKLNAALNQDEPESQIEIINLGVIGYSSFQGRRLLQTIESRFSPDAAVIWFGFNDSLFFHKTDEEAADHPPRLIAIQQVLMKSFAYSFFVKRMEDLRQSRESVWQIGQRIVRRVPPEDYKNNLLEITHHLKMKGLSPIIMNTPVRPGIPLILNAKLIRTVTPEGAVVERLQCQYELEGYWLMDAERFPGPESELDRLLLKYPELPVLHYFKHVFLKEKGNLDSADRELRLSEEQDSERAAIESYNQIAREVALKTDAGFIDLQARFLEMREHALFVDDCHPNINGHVIIARALYDYFTKSRH